MPDSQGFKTIKTHVHGVSHGDRQDMIKRFCKSGTIITLKREPNNPYGHEAIGVWVKGKSFFSSSDVQIGYVASDLAKRLAPIMDAGGKVAGKVLNVTGGTREKQTRGVNIELEVWHQE